MKSVLPAALFILCVASCNPAPPPADNTHDSLQAIRAGDSLRIIAVERAIEMKQKEIDSMLVNFTIDTTMTYNYFIHKQWGNLPIAQRNTFVTSIDHVGKPWITSNLDPAQKQQEMIELKSKDTILSITTSDFKEYNGPPYDMKRNSTQLSLMEGEIVSQMVARNPSAEITVSIYSGGEIFLSYSLSAEDRNAMVESYRLSVAIVELEELRADVEKQKMMFEMNKAFIYQ